MDFIQGSSKVMQDTKSCFDKEKIMLSIMHTQMQACMTHIQTKHNYTCIFTCIYHLKMLVFIVAVSMKNRNTHRTLFFSLCQEQFPTILESLLNSPTWSNMISNMENFSLRNGKRSSVENSSEAWHSINQRHDKEKQISWQFN